MLPSLPGAAGFLAPPYLLVLLVIRRCVDPGWPFLLASAVGPAVFAWALAEFLAARRGGDRVPPRRLLLLWGGVAALQLHAAVPVVAEARVVPAALFFALAHGLRPATAIPSMIGVAAWIPLMAHRAVGEAAPEFASIAALGMLSGAAGIVLRKTGAGATADAMRARETAAWNRSLVLPREDDRSGGPGSFGDATVEAALLRRGEELAEGIRQALERLLHLTGASHVGYLSPSTIPGAARHEGLLASRGEGPPIPFSVPDTYAPVREAIVFRRPFLEEGPAARAYALREAGKGSGASGIAAVPVFRGEAVAGVLLAVREEGGWPESVAPQLELAAFFLGRDLERTRLFHEGERYLLREDWYHRMVRKMANAGGEGAEAGESLALRRRKVYAEAVGQLRRQVGASRALLIGTSDGGKTGWVTWEETGSGAGGADRPEPLEGSYAGWVIRTGSRRIVSGDGETSGGRSVLPAAWAKEGERSFLMLPVAGVGGFRGAVVCCSAQEKAFQRQHGETAREITEVMQLGLSHVGHLEMLTKRADTDGLTGLPNRKSFLRGLEAELARLDGRHPLAVIMMDIDHFKRINDTHGHPFGDEVLRRVSAVLGKAIRRGDGIGRYGGEEFVLFLPMADPVKAVEGAERFRRMVRQTKFLREGKSVAVTASFGVACAPGHGNGPEELLKKADDALYLSKQRGRDRVTLFPG